MSMHRLVRSFGHAFAGIVFVFRYNQNIRVHFVVAVLVVVASIYFKVTPFEMGILGVMILLVLSSEMINTAIEEMVNFVTIEHQREAKIAKDVSAGMVLLTAVGSIIVGLLVFIPHIIKIWG